MSRQGQLFDVYVAVDWSAAAKPRQGRDSIWIAVARGDALRFHNPPTRAVAEALVDRVLADATAAGERVIIGLDAVLGFPAGTAAALGVSDWRGVFRRIAAELGDDETNRNDRFHAAARLNAAMSAGEGPFWFNALAEDIPGLPRERPTGWGVTLPPARRRVERDLPGAQEVWQMGGAGAVGGQSLTAIPVVERLRQRHRLAVWPFEWPDAEGRHVLAEIFPSALGVVPATGEVKDRAQVRAVARAMAAADAGGELAAMLDAAPRTPEVVGEEGWILGQTPSGNALAPCAAEGHTHGDAPRMRYLRDPAAIYRRSFEIVRAEARLDRFPPGMDQLAIRVIHACGMVEVADRLAFSPDAYESGARALAAGAPVLCDCRMVAAGIIRDRLPADNPVIQTLGDPEVPDLAAELGTTRSAAAVERWRPHIEGAVVAIGNAPTALFHLLERLDAGWPRPAVILGFPVGFVGAAESKAALARAPARAPFVTLRGRRGGSAMASAAVNALAAGLPEETTEAAP